MATTTAEYKNIINSKLPTNGNKQISASKLREVLTAGTSAIDNVLQTVTNLVAIGTFDASSGIATNKTTGATETLVTLANKPIGSYYDIVVAGTNSVTGVSKAMSVGGKLPSYGTTWGYVPPVDTGFAKANELEKKLPSKNLFDKTKATDGKMTTNTGVQSSNATYSYSEYIPVVEGKTYFGKGATNGMRYTCYYDAGLVVVAGGIASTATSFIPPSGAKFVIITIFVADKNTFQLELSDVQTEYADYGAVLQAQNVIIPSTLIRQDKGYLLTNELEKNIAANPYGLPLIEEFKGSNANGGVANGANGTITIPNGSTGSNSYLSKTIFLANYPQFEVGQTIAFDFFVEESNTNYATNAIVKAALTVVRSGVASTATISNYAFLRIDAKHFKFTFDYVIQTGDTDFVPRFSKQNVNNDTGGNLVFTVLEVDLIWKSSPYRNHITYDVFNLKNRVQANENVVKYISLDSQLTGAFTGVPLASGIVDTVLGTISVPNGATGSSSVLYRTLPLSLDASIKVGTIITFNQLIEESTAGSLTDWISAVAGLIALRDGSNISISGFTVARKRITSTTVLHTYQYTVQAGDTVLFPRLQKSNVSNSTGITQTWKILSMYYSTDSVADLRKIERTSSSVEVLNDRWVSLELKGLLQKRCDMNSPIESKIATFVSKQRLKRQDVTVVMLDGSISTDQNYATKRSDEAYRPPLCTENNIPSMIEEKLRWKGQQYRRYDSKTVMGGATAVFTETGTGVTQNMDNAWDWQFGSLITSGYNGLTRILTGSNPAISYSFPANNRRCDFVHRTDYLSSGSLIIAITGGSGKVEAYNETTQSWVEANGYVFSAKETDTLIAGTYAGATNLRKTIYQKRLKMRKVEADIANPRTVSITSQDGGRLCYWGVAYSPRPYMFQFINAARGSHKIAEHENFEAWAVDYWKPDLFLFSCNTINESASLDGGNPNTFVTRFENYINKIKGKAYTPDVFAYILFTSKGSGILDVNDVIGTAYNATYGGLTVFDFIDSLYQKLKTMDIASVNAFYEFWNIGKARSEYFGTKMYDEMFTSSGNSGDSFVIDGTHLNDYGAKVGWRFLEKYFNI